VKTVITANKSFTNGPMKMTQNGRFRAFYTKNVILALLMLFQDDVSMMSSAGPGYRWVTWQLTGQ